MVKKQGKANGSDGDIFIVFSSHRQRDKNLYLLAKKTGYCSFKRETGQGCYKVSKKEIEKLREHKAKFRVLRKPYDDLLKCWSR